MALGRPTEARKAFERALGAGEGPHLLLDQARAALQCGDLPGAEKLCRQYLKVEDDAPAALEILARAQARGGATELAIETTGLLCRADPGPGTELLRSNILTECGVNTTPYLQNALKRWRGNPVLIVGLAELLLTRGEVRAAKEFLEGHEVQGVARDRRYDLLAQFLTGLLANRAELAGDAPTQWRDAGACWSLSEGLRDLALLEQTKHPWTVSGGSTLSSKERVRRARATLDQAVRLATVPETRAKALAALAQLERDANAAGALVAAALEAWPIPLAPAGSRLSGKSEADGLQRRSWFWIKLRPRERWRAGYSLREGRPCSKHATRKVRWPHSVAQARHGSKSPSPCGCNRMPWKGWEGPPKQLRFASGSRE